MSGLVVGIVLKHSRSRGNSRLVLIVIGDSCKDDGTGAWPSVPLIATRAGISQRTVQRCLQDLVEIGELRIRYKAGPREANLYDIPIGILGGVKLSPAGEGGDKNKGGGDTDDTRVVTPVTPDPSYTSVDPSVRERRGRHKLSEDFILTEEQRDYAYERHVNPDIELARFKDYYLSAGTRWERWDLVWQRWCRNVSERSNGQGTFKSQKNRLSPGMQQLGELLLEAEAHDRKRSDQHPDQSQGHLGLTDDRQANRR